MVKYHPLGCTRASTSVNDAIGVGVNQIADTTKQFLLCRHYDIGRNLFHINDHRVISSSNRFDDAFEAAIGNHCSWFYQ